MERDRLLPAGSPLAAFVARHERALIAAWLALCAAALGALALWGLWLNGAERAVDAHAEAWVARLDEAQALLDAGRTEQATALLERLDADCPATFVKHRQDRERERLLAMLGSAYLADGRKGRALDAFQRAAEFDPRNFANHFRLAEGARELRDLDRARDAYEAVLAIHPTHLPSVSALADLAFDAGDYARVVETFERYLDAWLLAEVRLKLGEREVRLELPVDGRPHTLEALFELPSGWNGPLTLETRGFSARCEWIEFDAPLRAGLAERSGTTRLEPLDDWPVAGAERAGPREIVAREGGSSWSVPEVAIGHGAGRVRLELTLYKSVGAELWTQAQKAYANRLEHARWRAVLERARAGGAPEAGSVFED